MPNDILSAAEQAELRSLVAEIIPASAKYGVPGADDALIFADILKSVGRDHVEVRAALEHLGQIAGGSFSALEPARRTAVAAQLREEGGNPAAVLGRVVLLCYYRDDRVMHSLGLEPRPPFPKGHVLEQGDWSLLDPVRARKPFWRAAP